MIIRGIAVVCTERVKRNEEGELKELEKARTMEIVFDEDCPETTPERALRFRRVNPPREAKRA